MPDNTEINSRFLIAAKTGRLEEVKELINLYGLSYSEHWSEGYILLRSALENRHSAVAKLLLTSGSEVNCKTVHANQGHSDTALHLAVMNNDVEIVEMLLERNANVHVKNYLGCTPLHSAIEYKIEWKIMELLLKHGADVNARNNYGETILHVAIKIASSQIVEQLLNNGAYVNSLCSRQNAPLHLAVEFGREDVMTFLLARGAMVNIRKEDDITSLHIAAQKGNAKIAENLLNKGADIYSLTFTKGYTPLHFACEGGHEDIVKLLLNKGADINSTTKDSLSVLYVAVQNGHKQLVKLLLQHGAKIDDQDKDGRTILNLAVEKKSLIIVNEILKYCPDINNQSNMSSLIIAVRGFGDECRKIVESLLEYGFTVNAEDSKNPQLLHDVSQKGYLTILEDLLKNGTDVNMVHKINNREQGFTPLHTAVIYKQENVAQLLISYGADINAKNIYGKTPIFYAIDNGDNKMTYLLLKNGAVVKDNNDLLITAIEKKSKEIVEALLQHDVDINATDDPIPLHLAALKGHQDIVETLLKFGAEVNRKDKSGRTALHIASRGGYYKIILTLLKYGSDINITCESRKTHLEHAEDGSIMYYRQSGFDYVSNIEHCGNDIAIRVLRSHIIKMFVANLYVSQENLCFLARQFVEDDFAGKENFGKLVITDETAMRDELAIMKGEKIKNTLISFYDILVNNTNSLAKYTRNENIVAVLKSGEYKELFPIYASIIECNLRKGIKRKNLLEQSNEIIRLYFNDFSALPYDCIENILCYFSNKELSYLKDIDSTFKTDMTINDS